MKHGGIAIGTELTAGEAVRKWRAFKGLIQKQLASAADMDVAQLSAIEANRNSPSLRTVSRLAAALGISPVELLSTPPDNDGHKEASSPSEQGREVPSRGDFLEAIPIMRPGEKDRRLPKRDILRMGKAIAAAAADETARQADVQTTLPLAFPIAVSEGGAEQLAHFLRSHLDVGSAILRDVFSLFECHGIRILKDAALQEKKPPAATFYSRRRRTFTVFLSTALDGEGKGPRKAFVFLTEIGRAFLFASRGFEPFLNSDRSRRFAHHFAATFLMPESAVRMMVYSRRIKPGDWTFERLLDFKERFGVSAEAFNIRLKELGLITLAKYTAFKKTIGDHYAATDHGEPMP